MTDFAVTPPAANDIPVRGGYGQFPVRRAYCVGRSYAAHARETGSGPDHGSPFFFYKPADAVRYVADGETNQFVYPTEAKDCRYEIELVVAIGTGGRDIAVEMTTHHVYSYAVDLDMTRCNLQNATKRDGRPRETDKTFDGSAPIGPIMPAKGIVHPDKGAVMLSINGYEHQHGDLSDLIWSMPGTIVYLSCLFELRPGDLVYTGTLEGVGPVVVGDLMVGKIDGVGELHVRVI